MKTKTAILASSAMLLIGFATVGEAKRFGGGKSSGTYTAPAKKTDNKEDELPEEKGSPAMNIRLPVSGGSGASTSNATASAGAAALGAATGSAAANALSPDEAKKTRERQALEAQLAQKEEEELKAREAAEEALKKEEQARIAALAAAARAAREKREQQEAERRARIENEKEIERQRQASANRCVFKPVMTDDEIAICREAGRNSSSYSAAVAIQNSP